MPSVFVPTPQFPNVVPFPGVPPLLVAPNAAAAILPILAFGDVAGLPNIFGQSQWGIFDQSGGVVIESDSTYSMEYARDYHVSDYPQEQGAFQSYNKVQLPYQAKVTFIVASTRFEFLNTIEAAVASLDLFVVVTPEIQYANANLTHYNYRREARAGVTLIAVDVWCEEIRQSVSTTFGNTQSTNATPAQPNGVVQPQTTTPGPGGSAPYTATIPTQTQTGVNTTVLPDGGVNTIAVPLTGTNTTATGGGFGTTTAPPSNVTIEDITITSPPQ